jgi:ribosomal protein L24
MLDHAMSLALKVNGGELFLVEGCGYLLAQRVKRSSVLLETDKGKVTGALVVDYNNKIGLVGKDHNGNLKVLVREGIDWSNGTLELRNGDSDQVLLKVGTNGFESMIKEGYGEANFEKGDFVEVIGGGYKGEDGVFIGVDSNGNANIATGVQSYQEHLSAQSSPRTIVADLKDIKKVGKLKEGKIMEPTDQDTQVVDKLVESVVKVGDKVRIRNNRFNQEVHKDLVGKIGRIQGEHHESYGLLYDVAMDDTDQVYRLDWRDVEPSDVVKDSNKGQGEAPQGTPEPGQNSVEHPMPSADLA